LLLRRELSGQDFSKGKNKLRKPWRLGNERTVKERPSLSYTVLLVTPLAELELSLLLLFMIQRHDIGMHKILTVLDKPVI